VVQFNIPRVIAGEARTFPGAPEFLRGHGVEVTNLDLEECVQMMEGFMRDNPRLWDEDIGK
jgi:cytosine deaminase